MDSLKTWFNTLEQRERLLVTIAGALLGIALLYLALLAPFNKLVDTRTARVEKKRQDLAWMQSVAPTLRALAMSQPGASGESLVVLIDRTARQSNISNSVTAQTPNGDHGMRVRLENANFDNVILWLASLQQQFNVGVESATIDRTDKSGVVNASLVLSRAAR